MKKIAVMLRIVIVLVLAFSMCLNIGIDKAWATGQFNQTCQNVSIIHNDDSNPDSIGKPTLTASCQKMDGSFIETSIDLNPYIGNNDGLMGWVSPETKKDFGLSCYDLETTDAGELKGKCLRDTKRDAKGKFIIPNPRFFEISIDLNEHIANIDGTLKYE